MGIQYESGHTPNEGYMDRLGNFHLNGSALAVDENASQISASAFVHPGANVAFTSVVTVAAAGTTQATAAALTGATNVVSGANGSNGVILPVPSEVGQEVSVLNTNGTNALKVYADSGGAGGTVNGGAGNAAASLAASKGATYLCTAVNPSAWWSLSN